MIRTLLSIMMILFFAVGATACGGEQAVKDLEALKEKTCACKDKEGDEKKKCIDDATKSAKEWAEKHKDARGGDQEKAAKLAGEIATCAPTVGLALAAAAEEKK